MIESLRDCFQASLCALAIAGMPVQGLEVAGIRVHKVPLRQNDDSSPYCLAVSSAMDINTNDNLSAERSNFPEINFLATQVWPSARVAASALETFMNPEWIFCEFGCGPGLPSLTAASVGAKKVYATDLDDFSLELVKEAAKEQNLNTLVETVRIDLTAKPDNNMPKADLYLFSDVFESSKVAVGAAEVSRFILDTYRDARIWVFAQSDRACREVYIDEMKKHLQTDELTWTPLDQYDLNAARRKVFLCDLDEMKVSY
jgi:SAM-dependent methyltransferase